jgi:hypothetical protein
MRGRNGGGNNNNNNNNRRGPNPLNRNYESNGPDVKIRGSAQQIAEKYTTLARDAMSSGDRVMAENYLQHAEHYNRIIAAAQAQMPIQHQQQNRDDFDDDTDENREDTDNAATGGEAQVPVVNHGAGPQPVIEGTPAEVALNGDGNGGNRHNRDRRDRGNGQRGEQGRRDEAQSGDDAVSAEPEQATQPESFSPAAIAAQADRNGTDRTRAGEKSADRAGTVQNDAGTAEEAPKRARRPRRPRAAQQESAAESAAAEAADTAPAEG